MDNERDGPKFKVGDRVETEYGRMATVVEVDKDHLGSGGSERYPNHLQHDSGPMNWWPDNQLELISPSTEPLAQEADKMQAYLWIAWKRDKDGKRVELVGDESMAWMVVAENEAEARRKADFKLSETLDLEKPDDITEYEVEVRPFGG